LAKVQEIEAKQEESIAIIKEERKKNEYKEDEDNDVKDGVETM
jgi:hypothetical protein